LLKAGQKSARRLVWRMMMAMIDRGGHDWHEGISIAESGGAQGGCSGDAEQGT